MCEFLSAIVTKDGSVLCEPTLDSHSDLIELFRLREGRAGYNFVRVEFVPRLGLDGQLDYSDVDSYELWMDETRIPSWWEECEPNARKFLLARVKNMIINDERAIVAGGAWILGPSARVQKMDVCKIIWAHRGAVIKDAGYATISNAGAAKIEYAGYATINNAGGSTISNAGYATIKDAGAATIDHAGRSTIHNAGNATVKHAGTALIRDAGRSTIHNAGSSTINDAGAATIEHAGTALIHNAGGSTISNAGTALIRDAGYAVVDGVQYVAGRRFDGVDR
jgi:16S rRNA C1402 (ribose-2'-O) methylase RsmI